MSKSDLPEEMFADLVLMNCKIITLDKSNTVGGAVAIKGEWIMKVGTDEEIKKMIGEHTKLLVLTGKTVLPGFIDAHVHMSTLGQRALPSRYLVDGSDVKSIRDIQNLVAAEVKKAKSGEWIHVTSAPLGTLVDSRRLAERRQPNRYDLDPFSPDNPVCLIQSRGPYHGTVILNGYALKMASITKDTLDPPDYGFRGNIDRDNNGEPTGKITGDMLAHLSLFAPSWAKWGWAYRTMSVSVDELKSCIKAGGKKMLEQGITTVHEPKISPLEFQAYQELLREEKKPKIPRVCCYLICGEYSWAYWGRLQNMIEHIDKLKIERGLGNNRLKIAGIKIYVDGGLAQHTAALSEDYADDPGNKGLIVLSSLMFRDRLRIAWRLHMQAEIHAVGDRAIEQVLNTITFLNMEYPIKDHRNRLNHCEVWRPDLIKRVKELGLIAAPQQMRSITQFGDLAEKALGPERVKMFLPFRTLLDAGIPVCASSDGSGYTGLQNIWAAVCRRTETGKMLCPEERITVMEAIRMHTYWSAYAGFEEDIKGSIEKGKLADFVVLGQDPLTVDPEKIKDIPVEMTILGGRVVHSASEEL